MAGVGGEGRYTVPVINPDAAATFGADAEATVASAGAPPQAVNSRKNMTVMICNNALLFIFGVPFGFVNLPDQVITYHKLYISQTMWGNLQ